MLRGRALRRCLFAHMPTVRDQVIFIHPDAPPKPREGAPCNGCGVCCLAEPCPVGMVLSLKRRGACKRLRWSAPQGRYVCGLLAEAQAQPPSWWRRATLAWARRLISAGTGCDASLTVELGPSAGAGEK